ncbi:hypothetical protein CPB83DRAFT_900718 [Crepidotus variabilis]|uniref:Secreted protein n=1 Tax=Crepidotus variabilis TaxID=179855 RepID=A0A9P6E2J8_9AGAR|nr:hypothetical protein CPB83DRAFT_900718 [Crepidotus variabilis]
MALLRIPLRILAFAMTIRTSCYDCLKSVYTADNMGQKRHQLQSRHSKAPLFEAVLHKFYEAYCGCRGCWCQYKLKYAPPLLC